MYVNTFYCHNGTVALQYRRAVTTRNLHPIIQVQPVPFEQFMRYGCAQRFEINEYPTFTVP